MAQPHPATAGPSAVLWIHARLLHQMVREGPRGAFTCLCVLRTEDGGNSSTTPAHYRCEEIIIVSFNPRFEQQH